MENEMSNNMDNNIINQMIDATKAVNNMMGTIGNGLEKIQVQMNKQEEKINDMSATMYNMNATIKDLKNEQKETNEHISKLEDTTLIDPREMKKIKKAARYRVLELLKYETNESKVKYKPTCFAWIYDDLDNELDIPASGYIKKIDLEYAINFISTWEPRDGLEALKDYVNKQLKIKKRIENEIR